MRYDIRVDAREVNAVLAAILRAPAETRRRVSGRLQRRTKQKAEQEWSNYPAERPGQTYERTGNLRESWDVHVSTQGEALAVDIRNDATGPDGRAYAIYVIGERQAWFHVGRWTDGDEAINDYLDDVGNEYVRTYLDVLRESGRR